MIRLVVDCLGGDNSPSANVKGAVIALAKYEDLSLILTGDEEAIKKELNDVGFSASGNTDRLEIIHAPEVITGEDKPTDAIRLKKNSSMMQAVHLVHSDETVDGMISTGATGALVAAGMLKIGVGRLPGVIRPSFCPVIPTVTGSVVGICDSGANVQCVPLQLQQQAIMGSLYMKSAFGVEEPRVALLNVGVESEKGDDLHREAYQLLKETPGIHFVGNMESRDLLSGKYDLIVCDGFTGNVLLKTTEGTALSLLKKIKTDIYSKLIYKIGALFMSRMFKEEKEFMNYQNYGGSVLLGTKKPVVKGHGSSDATAVFKSIELAYRMRTHGLEEKITEALKSLPSGE